MEKISKLILTIKKIFSFKIGRNFARFIPTLNISLAFLNFVPLIQHIEYWVDLQFCAKSA